jgi:hypothetical protein
MRLSGIRNLRSGRRCPETKKRNHDELEAEMEEMSSMSESEIQAVIDEQARKKQEADRKFLEYRRSTQGEAT